MAGPLFSGLLALTISGSATKKRREALFSWNLWNEHSLLADGEPARLDVAEFPGQQHAEEQNHREADPNSQGPNHAATFGASVAPVLQHEEQRKTETRQDADEGEGDDVFHDPHYPRPEAHGPVIGEIPTDVPARTHRGARFWVITLTALLVLASTLSLGRWQLSRAAQKEALQAEIDQQKRLPALDQDAFLATDKEAGPAMYRLVRLRGLWLAPHTVYLDNRQMHGLQGFYVLTPFAIEGSKQAVLVQRGWVQRNFNDRTQIGEVDTPQGLVELSARIAPPPGHLLALGKEAPSTSTQTPAGSSRIRQNLDLDAFRNATGLPMRTEISLQEVGVPSEGLQRDWPAPALGVERHYGYAFQWFGLAALVVLLYVWFQFIAPIRSKRRARRH